MEKVLPMISVLLAVKNESQYIENTLKMLFEQDYPQDKYEVLVADGCSDDGTPEIVRKFAEKHENCILLENKKILSASGWNLGVEHSRGEIVSFLSGHVDFEKSYYSKLVKRLTKDLCGVGGPSFTKGKGLKGKIISLAYLSIFGSGGASFLSDSEEGDVESIVFGCYWKKDIQKAGGFDENCFRGQDWDLNVRLRSLGYRLYKVNDVKTEPFVRDSFKSLWKRHYNAGLWKMYINRKYKNAFLIRHLIPPVFSLGLTAAIITGLFWNILLLIPAVIFLLYLIISIQMTIKYHLKFYNIFIFMPVFFIIHYSYGVGFILGLGKHEK
jgi:glycosyltransferase involved in cell wall biosynthesis